MRLLKMILFYHQDDLDFVKHLINVCLLNPFMTEAVIIYRNQFIDLLCKSMDWFLYDKGLRHERVKKVYINS